MTTGNDMHFLTPTRSTPLVFARAASFAFLAKGAQRKLHRYAHGKGIAGTNEVTSISP